MRTTPEWLIPGRNAKFSCFNENSEFFSLRPIMLTVSCPSELYQQLQEKLKSFSISLLMLNPTRIYLAENVPVKNINKDEYISYMPLAIQTIYTQKSVLFNVPI